MGLTKNKTSFSSDCYNVVTRAECYYTQTPSYTLTTKFSDLNNGVYKAGFAIRQRAYDKAVTKVFTALDRVEEILSRQRYLTGHTITLADIRLYTTLARFDCVYYILFKVYCRYVEC